MANWLLNISEKWLRPVYDVLREQLCRESVLHADETTLQVLKNRDVPPPASPTCAVPHQRLHKAGHCAV